MLRVSIIFLVLSLGIIPVAQAGIFSDLVDSIAPPAAPLTEDEKAHPQAYAYFNSGMKKFNSKDYNGAAAEFTRAIESYPEFAGAYKSRGDVRGWLDDDKGWIEDLNMAIRLKPNIADYYADRAVAKGYVKDWAGKIADYEKALTLDPDNQAYIESLDAARYLLSMVMEEKSHPQAYAYFKSGVEKHSAKDYQGAIAQYTHAIESDSKFAHAFRARGNAKSLLGDHQGRVKDLSIAIKLSPKNAIYYIDRGDSKSHLEDWGGQLEDYQKAVSLEPHNQSFITKSDQAKANLSNLVFSALDSGDVAQAEKLLKSGANIDWSIKDKNNRTYLHRAVQSGEIDIVRLLVSKGADVNAVGPIGKTPLHLATEFRQQAVVEYLIAHGANINAQNIEGNTPLHSATFPLNRVPKSIAEFLIAKGADVTIKNNAGFTALESDEYSAKLGRDINEKIRAETQSKPSRASASTGQAFSGKQAYGSDASSCVQSMLGYTNTCDQTIQIDLHALSGSGGNFCTGEGVHTLYPHQTLNVPASCVSFINLRGAIFLN